MNEREVGPPVPDRLADRLVTRWPAARPFVIVGSVAVIAGGVTAALTRPTDFELGSWLAAYLVLVGGVAQIALGLGQAWLADQPPRAAVVRSEVASWNLGSAATIVGSLASVPLVTTVGGAATFVALALFFRAARSGGPELRWPRLLYLGLIAIVMISTPVGLALAWIRHG